MDVGIALVHQINGELKMNDKNRLEKDTKIQ